MGRKSKETTFEERKIIFNLRREGKTLQEISNATNRRVSAIHSILQRNSLQLGQRSGRPAKLKARDKAVIIRKIKEQPRTSAPEINRSLAEYSGIHVSDETVRRTLRAAGYNGRTPRIKPLISEKNRRKRLEFARKYVNYGTEFWSKVIFSDETKFNIFGPDCGNKVWRKVNTEMHHKNTVSSVKHGGGNVMLWGCMSANGVGNMQFITDKMDHRLYIQILKDNLNASANKLGLSGRYIFQQDNDPKHTAQNTKLWILYNTPSVLGTPPQSPDLNPIEHLWADLERAIRKHGITSKDRLKTAIVKEWEKISAERTRKLVFSMQNRLREVIKMKGYATRY